MIQHINKFLSNTIRIGVIAAIGFSLYFIYNNYDSYSLNKNVVQVQPQNTTRIMVTTAD